jgi:HlyD family secretion protein
MNPNTRSFLPLALLMPALHMGCSQQATTTSKADLYTVTKGDLRITVTEAATLQAARSVDIKSELEGNHTVIYLVPEGTRVEAGKKLVELDASDLVERRSTQEINYEKAKAAYEQAEENYKIVQKQNESDTNAATLKVRYSELDLEKFHGKILDQGREDAGDEKHELGKRELDLKDAQSKIKIAQEELKRAQDRCDWSVKLEKKGFITRTELDADRFSVTKCETNLVLAENNLKLLVEYDQRKEDIRLLAELTEAGAELERVKSRCHAKLLQEDADRKAKKATYELEREKLDKLRDQISKAVIHAPKPGLVVYATFGDGGRRGRPQLIEEGMQVRERQTMIILPDVTSMLALASVHESQIVNVKEGQVATAKVDAAGEISYGGRVTRVAVLPDSSQSFMSPEIKVYRTEITLDGDTSTLRPGMSASLELLISDLRDVVFVPVHAVHRVGRANFVWLAAEPQPVARRVTVGLHNDQFIHVKDGLQAGDTILLAPPDLPNPEFPGEKEAAEAEERAALARRVANGQNGLNGLPGENGARADAPGQTSEDAGPRRGPGGPGGEEGGPRRGGNRPPNPAMTAFMEKVKAKFPDLGIASTRDLFKEEVRNAIQADPELQAEQARLMANMGGPGGGRRRGPGGNNPGGNSANGGTGGTPAEGESKPGETKPGEKTSEEPGREK